MYAIVEDRGKQYKLKEGMVFHVDLLPLTEGQEVEMEKVLLLSSNQGTEVGTPYLKNVKVACQVQGHKKGKKVTVYKYKRRKGYHKKQGHRQRFTTLKVLAIQKG
ncbi:MAG: 50S ribosomal protein L21 [Planctomycetota bacterium]|nr:MAG: 50S ribosomal protein L21 [Planctomycetota bacterium]